MGVGQAATVGFMRDGVWVPVQEGSNPLPTSGGGGGATVTSVNGATGAVVLDAGDVGALPDSYTPTWASVTGKPATFAPAAHTHAAADITSGTFAAARIPNLAISKVTGLQAALDSKLDAADYVAVPNPPAEGQFSLESVDGVMSWVEIVPGP